jgi:hypothetical protein
MSQRVADVVLSYLGRRKRSPSDAGDRPHHRFGTQFISNAQLPAQRQLDDKIRRAHLRSES